MTTVKVTSDAALKAPWRRRNMEAKVAEVHVDSDAAKGFARVPQIEAPPQSPPHLSWMKLPQTPSPPARAACGTMETDDTPGTIAAKLDAKAFAEVLGRDKADTESTCSGEVGTADEEDEMESVCRTSSESGVEESDTVCSAPGSPGIEQRSLAQASPQPTSLKPPGTSLTRLKSSAATFTPKKALTSTVPLVGKPSPHAFAAVPCRFQASPPCRAVVHDETVLRAMLLQILGATAFLNGDANAIAAEAHVSVDVKGPVVAFGNVSAPLATVRRLAAQIRPPPGLERPMVARQSTASTSLNGKAKPFVPK